MFKFLRKEKLVLIKFNVHCRRCLGEMFATVCAHSSCTRQAAASTSINSTFPLVAIFFVRQMLACQQKTVWLKFAKTFLAIGQIKNFYFFTAFAVLQPCVQLWSFHTILPIRQSCGIAMTTLHCKGIV